MWYEISEKLSLLSLHPFHQHAPNSCQHHNSFWKLLQYHKQRRIALARKTWQEQRKAEKSATTHQNLNVWCTVVFGTQWGYTSPSLFNSRTSGQYLVRPFLLEIILSRGMRRHCCTWRLQKQVWALGVVHLHFSWAERKLVSHFTQTKPVRPNLGQCVRYCCK